MYQCAEGVMLYVFSSFFSFTNEDEHDFMHGESLGDLNPIGALNSREQCGHGCSCCPGDGGL